ncbi:unnamed protein product [Rhizophagus irregularis]|nr:unnamed protein product [Rhizophagus irregularis]
MDMIQVILECSSSITDWPSSTRAELGAILSAILVLQTGQRANIFTDSQAAIDSINHTRINLTNGKNKIRIWCKSNNYSIISSIINLIDSKHLEIKLIKVKGHSGVKGNEEADRVAKNDTGKSTCITINDSQQKDLKYDLYWDAYKQSITNFRNYERRRYDLYGDVKCRLCLVENEDDDHIIYCQQLRDKWLIMANNTINKCEQCLKTFSQKRIYSTKSRGYTTTTSME